MFFITMSIDISTLQWSAGRLKVIYGHRIGLRATAVSGKQEYETKPNISLLMLLFIMIHCEKRVEAAGKEWCSQLQILNETSSWLPCSRCGC